MQYRDPLPEDCPPPEAAEINRPSVFFRMVHNDPPTEADFLSQRQENPAIQLRNLSECHARGVSLFSAKRDASRLIRQGKFAGCSVVRISLDAGMGAVLKSGSRSHFTWWPAAGLDYAALCRVDEQ